MECRDAPTERPRPAPGQALSRSVVALDQNSTIIAVIEMSQSSWLVAGMLPGIERQPRKKLEPSPERLLALLQRWQDEAVRAGRTITRFRDREGFAVGFCPLAWRFSGGHGHRRMGSVYANEGPWKTMRRIGHDAVVRPRLPRHLGAALQGHGKGCAGAGARTAAVSPRGR
jgi:hypothetical protein